MPSSRWRSSTRPSPTNRPEHGQIDAASGHEPAPTRFTAAIIGGTGAYERVTGQVVNVVISPSRQTIDRTLYLIYPIHHR
jgi:hypothetical protein